MGDIGLYKQLTDFTNAHAGTGEWCIALKNSKKYFVKKLQTPVYPSKELGLPEKKYHARAAKFHATANAIKAMYQVLNKANSSGALVIPVEVINYQYHICTAAEYVVGNVKPEQVCRLSEWQRIVLMRTLTLALMEVHQAGVVHSDIKTDNVLITQNADNGSCVLKLIDFDGSFMEIAPPDEENTKGSMEYWAPEMFAMETMPNIRLGAKIDVFALGIVFHEFWTGKKPAISPPKGYIGKCILNGNSVKLDALLPSSLRTLISKMLVADPAKRATAANIYSDLEELLAQYPAKIVNLQKTTIEPPKTPPPEEPKYASVEVICRSSTGAVLSKRIEKVQYGKSQWFYPIDIEGYRLANGERAIKVAIDSKGIQDKKCEFVYKKKAINKLLGWIVDTCICLLLSLPLVTYFAAETGLWDIAKFCKDLTPFYSQVFEEHAMLIDQGATSDTIILCEESFLSNNEQCFRLINAADSDSFQYLRFIPEETGNYTFTAWGMSEANGYIYDKNRKQLSPNKSYDSNWKFSIGSISIGELFKLEHYFVEGRTYYLGVFLGKNKTIWISVASM